MPISGDLEPGGYRLTNFITPTTTPAQFDAERAQVPAYKLTHGGRCGWNALGAAASNGNVLLIEHIVQIGGKELLELGRSGGLTPLYCAAEAGQFKAAKKLLDLGANVNAEGHGGETCFRTAVLAKHAALTKLLLLRDAEVPADLAAGAFVADVRASIEADKEGIRVAVAAPLPPVLWQLVVDYTGALQQPEEVVPDPVAPEEIVPELPPEGISCCYCSIM